MLTRLEISRTWIIAGSFGAAIVAAVLAFGLLRSPKAPDPASASTREVARFLASKSTDTMSKDDKYRYIRAYVDRNNTPEGIAEMRRALSAMSDTEIRRLQDQAIDAITGGMMTYSRRFNATTSQAERKKIVAELAGELAPYEAFAHTIVRDVPNVQRIAIRSPKDTLNLAMKRISPPELAAMEPMFVEFLALRVERLSRPHTSRK